MIFIFIDNFDKSIDLDPAELARKLCPRGTSVGADGLAFLEPDEKYDFQWRFHNADGSAAEMCGNASRCAAWLMNKLGHTGTEVKFRTLAGVIGAAVKGDYVRVEMTRPLAAEPRFKPGSGRRPEPGLRVYHHRAAPYDRVRGRRRGDRHQGTGAQGSSSSPLRPDRGQRQLRLPGR